MRNAQLEQAEKFCWIFVKKRNEVGELDDCSVPRINS